MASTLIIYQGTGSQTDFIVPFDYLKKSFVTVSLEGTLLTGGDLGDTGSDYFFVDKTTIRLKVAPPAGQFLTVRRYTSETERVVTFKDASVLKASDLDISQLQAFHIAAEARDIINDALIQDKFDNWDAKNHRIVNLADPVDPQDAVTYKVYKEDAQGAYQSRLGAQRAQAASQEAQRASQVAQGKAQAAQGASQAAQKASEAAQSAAQIAQSATQSARDIALQAKSDTVTAKNEAVTAKTQAQTARTQAQSAQSSAQSAQSSAQSARDSALSSKTSAQSSATSAKNWAIKTDGPVEGSEYSAKYHATQAKTTVDGGVGAINSARDSAIQSVSAQGTKQLSLISTAGTTNLNAITQQGTNQVSLVTSNGTEQINLAKAQAERATEEASIAITKASEASQSASAARVSQDNAKASEDASKASQTNAKTSETNAKTSQTNSANSANSAATSAQSASNYASAASNSASEASRSANDAYGQAQRAKEYANQASTGQLQSDWSQTDSTQKDFIKNKPSLAAVATSGNYSDLIGVPEIPDPTWQNIQGKPSSFPPSGHNHTKAQITDFAHGHAISEIEGLQASLSEKQPVGDYATNTSLTQGLAGKLGVNEKAASAGTADSVAWTNVTGTPSTFPPSAHTHSTTQITGLDTALASKLGKTEKAASAAVADSANSVTWDNVSGKPAIPTTPNAYITQTWRSGSSWYRVWSDGFIEQAFYYNTSTGTITINFIKPFSSKCLGITVTNVTSSSIQNFGFHAVAVHDVTTSSFKQYVGNPVYIYACGY